ncbi:hypothetical protein F2Q70_00016929 [Brassica cretica]|uniref:Uncharacterized protein n=1 Tax=Brassica cretica TaxID=69181 RepID=A0A3N6RMM1_BRACR|nr:hypothetical protein F2Q70_00016929 [Brassica cretica]KAF2597834.1 hypothetical protein F2Q68_00009894 [Brassica cretica]
MIFRRVIVKSLQDNNNECIVHSVWMGKGSWSRRRHMTEARSSTEAGRRVVRQVHQIVIQYLLFCCSRGCVLIIHEETDGVCISHGREKHGVVHILWGRKTHLVWKFPDVCPEVVADVVAEADVMVSGEDHVESMC